MSYTPGFNFYVPDVDDTSSEYVPGFQRNFEILDKILTTLVNQSIVDKYATNPVYLDRKRVVTDRIISVYEGHKDAITFLTEKNKHEDAGETYLRASIENPHGITPDQLFSREDLDRSKTSSYELLTPNVNYNPKKNQGHNAIIDEINNNVSDDTNQNQYPTDRSKQIHGYGNTNGTLKPIIDYSNMYIQDIGNNKSIISENYEPYISQQERIDAKKYRNHKYIYVDIDNQIVNDYVNNENEEINTRRDRHISLKDVNHFESHIRNQGQYTQNEIRNRYRDMLASKNDINTIIKNPHNVTASELCDSYSNDNKTNVGSKAIIREINTLAKHQDFEYKDQNNKIYWELIDKNSITYNENGQGKKPSIADISDHKHNSLSDINGVNLSDIDEFQDKHISNLQGKKWEDHTNTELNNPHKVKVEQLYKKDGTYEGTKENPKSTIAIIEQINLDNDESIKKSEQPLYNNQKILWNVIDKNNIDGIGNKANILDIPIRLHDDLQEIHPVNINDTDYKKNKHLSDTQLNSLYSYMNIEESSNIHHVSPKSLIGLPKNSETPQKISVDLNYTIENNIVSIPMPMLNNEQKNNDLYLEIVFNEQSIKSSLNIDLYLNEYYLGQVNSKKNRNFIIPLFYITNNNKFIMYWNDTTPNQDNCKILTSLQYYHQERFTGRDSIIDEINTKNSSTDTIFKKILWERIDKDTSKLEEITQRQHRMLQDILGYEIIDDPNDPLDNKDTRNKHISCNDGGRWDNHVNTIDGSNPHKLKIQNIKGINDNRNGALAILDELNKYSLDNYPNQGLDKVGDNKLSWNIISKKEISLNDFPSEGKDHQKLTNILPIKFFNDLNNPSITDEDRIQNKHISNIEASKFNIHVDTVSNITGNEDTNNLVNPHKISAASLLSHKQPLTMLNTKFTGGNAIIDAINDYANDYSLLWNKINKQNSSITDIVNKNHNLLSNIRQPNKDIETKENIYDLHISQKEYNDWEKHRLNKDNPHTVKVEQLWEKEGGNQGVKAIVNVLNNTEDKNKIKINHTNINFNKNEKVNDFDIKDIPLRVHDDLQDVIVISGDEYSEIKGHVTTSQVKSWKNHLLNKNNPHHVIAEQIELGMTEEEKRLNALDSETLKDALFEIDSYRNKTTVGLSKIMFEPPKTDGIPDPSYYFDDKVTAIYVPICEVYLNNQPGFRGKIKKYTTPIVSINEDLPTEIQNKFGRNCYKIPLTDVPKNQPFVIVAYLDEGIAKIRVSSTNLITQITNGQSVNIMQGYISLGEDNNIKESYCLPVGNTALGLPEQIFNRMLFLNPTARQTGMSLSHDERDLDPSNQDPEKKKTDLSFIITEGSLWNGLQLMPFPEFKSKDNNESSPSLFLCIRNNKATDSVVTWTYQSKWQTAPNKICQGLDGGIADVPESTAEDIAQNKKINNIVTTFIYYVPAYRRTYMVMSEKLLADPNELDQIGNRIFPKALPDLVKSSGILVGLMLCKNGPIAIESKPDGGYNITKDGNQIPARIYSPFDLIFTNTTTDVSSTIDHNQLTGKFGSSPYWHLSNTQYENLQFLFDTREDEHGETGFDRKISTKLINKRIQDILKDNVDESVNDITKIANNTHQNTINKLSKNGDSSTGEYIFNTSSTQSNVISLNANNKSISMFIGNQNLSNKSEGYFLNYEKSKLSLLSQNKQNTKNASDIKNLKILDINSDGLINIHTSLNLSSLLIKSNININNGILNSENINSQKNTYGLILGNNKNQGSTLYNHDKDYAITVFRARNEKFEIDTFGALYINTDRSREEKNTQTNPAEPKNLKYLDQTGKANYNVYIGNIGTQDSPKYPIVLSNNEYSTFNNGILIGEKFNFVSQDKLSVNGNIKLNNNDISGVKEIQLLHYNIKTSNQTSISKILFNTNSDNGNLSLSIKNKDVLSFTFSNNKSEIVCGGKTSISLLNKVGLFFNNIEKLTTMENGIKVFGDIYSNENKVVLETRKINVSNGLSGGGNLGQDLNIQLSNASDTQLGGVMVDNKTIISTNGRITAKALQDSKFTMEYDNTVRGIVIKFN